MEYDEFDGPEGVPVRLPTSNGYRTCVECGEDCYPDPSISVGVQGVRIAFVCAQHGVQSIVDPFEGNR
ncbi:hypothetical protein GCM10007269_19390 [Microbacterium murale]|uniref:Uncharacterized protein n=1 Tax=Microbacterium murale TaxID=1081040 RepID=A0ABQ1RNX8_9MICO|nr:hypothetical protein GCM10007269_19390 [Microbacterium murale]